MDATKFEVVADAVETLGSRIRKKTISKFKMLVSVAFAAVLVYSFGVSAVPTTAPSSIKRSSKPLLRWTPPSTLPQMIPAFQAKIDWDLDNVSQRSSDRLSLLTYQHFAEPHNPYTIWSPCQLVESRVCLNILLGSRGADSMCYRGYWYDTEGQQFGEILRANDDGIVTPGPTAGTNYLELRA